MTEPDPSMDTRLELHVSFGYSVETTNMRSSDLADTLIESIDTKSTEWPTRTALDLKKRGLLYPNPEYQRGLTWNSHQQQKLIDSMLRGYPLPKFYMHRIEEVVEELDMRNKRWEIVDGQQRLNAIDMFTRGKFALLDPIDPKSRFPLFQRELDTPWAGLKYSDLDSGLQEEFLETSLTIVEIQEEDPNVIRDLFVRLQSGADLTSQERRDAYPGDFCEFVYSLGGKVDLVGAHAFFERPGVRGIKPSTPKSREFAAQLAMTVLNMDSDGGFSDINSQTLDEFYYAWISFDANGERAQLVRGMFDEIHTFLKDYQGPALTKHEVFHLAALWLELQRGYVPDWKDNVRNAVRSFNRSMAEAALTAKSENPNEFWVRYGSMARGSGSDKGSVFNRRHRYYLRWMRDYLKPTPKDETRGFDYLDRVLLWYESGGLCAYRDRDFCPSSSEMPFSDAQIHHIIPHQLGGSTCIGNSALVHASCNKRIGATFEPVCVDGDSRNGVKNEDCTCER